MIYLIKTAQPDGSPLVSPDLGYTPKARGDIRRMTLVIGTDRSVGVRDELVDVLAINAYRKQREDDEPTIELIASAIEAGQTSQSEIITARCAVIHGTTKPAQGAIPSSMRSPKC